MSGTTRSVQQPLDTHNILAVLGMAAAAIAATIAIAWGSANLVKTAPAALPVPAMFIDPVVRDLGDRDLGAAALSTGATHEAPVFSFGYLGYADGLRMQSTTSSEGAPATRHAGLRAQ